MLLYQSISVCYCITVLLYVTLSQYYCMLLYHSITVSYSITVLLYVTLSQYYSMLLITVLLYVTYHGITVC